MMVVGQTQTFLSKHRLEEKENVVVVYQYYRKRIL